jgi:uncharacterized membrane protein YdjX (TVP38/TMEM64 family)
MLITEVAGAIASSCVIFALGYYLGNKSYQKRNKTISKGESNAKTNTYQS